MRFLACRRSQLLWQDDCDCDCDDCGDCDDCDGCDGGSNGDHDDEYPASLAGWGNRLELLVEHLDRSENCSGWMVHTETTMMMMMMR